MHSKERVITTLYHEEPDSVPFFDFLYEAISIRRILGKEGNSFISLEDFMSAQRALEFDLVSATFNEPKGYKLRKVSPDMHIDEWGIKFKATAGYKGQATESMAWYVDGTIKTPEDLENLQIPDPYAEGRTRDMLKILKKYGEEMAIAPTVAGPFNMAWLVTGFEVFVKALYTNQPFACKLLTLINKFNIELGKIAIDLGAEFLWISDDLGDKNGPTVAPKQFRMFVKPLLKEMVGTFKKRGAWVLLHCDGNVMSIMDDIIDTGIDAFHPTERKAFGPEGLRKMKEMYGDKITLFGNVDASHLLPYGSLEEINDQIRECFETAAPGGGYIFGSDHSIHPGIPAERARFLFNRASKYRRYPTRTV